MRPILTLLSRITTILAHCNTPCTDDYRPVCGSDHVTYGNECAMRGEACRKQEAIMALYKGECAAEDPCNTLAVCTLDYRPTCGSDGQLYANMCHLRAASCRQKSAISITRLDGQHCEDCTFPCTYDLMPVCGSDGNTYANECMLRGQACTSRKAIVIIHEGNC